MQERFQAFTVLVASISRSIHKIKAEEMAQFDLKSSHVSCLYYLYRSDAMTATELCTACGEDKANVSRAVKYLEENGYLTCDTKAQKRYLSPLVLTEKGKTVGCAVAQKVDRALESASEGLTQSQRTAMYESLRLINENLNKICESYGEKKRD